MAQLDIADGEIRLQLSAKERLAGLHGDVTAPLSAVRSARATDRPFAELRGIRAPGTGWPNRIAIGTWRTRGAKDFAVLHRGRPAVVVELGEPAEFGRLLVSADDAPALAERIARAAA